MAGAEQRVLSNADAMHFIAGSTPSRLASLEPTDLAGFTLLTVPAATKTNQAAVTMAMKHNQLVIQDRERGQRA